MRSDLTFIEYWLWLTGCPEHGIERAAINIYRSFLNKEVSNG
jgi:hypothetical protein